MTRCFSDFRRGCVFLSVWAFSVWKLFRKSKRENDTISWNDLDCRLTKHESDCRALRGLISIWKWKKFRAPSTVGQLALYSSASKTSARDTAPNGEERCRRRWIGLSLAVDRIACQGWRLCEPSDREGTCCAVESMRVREACVRLFSLPHRANFVSVSPHPGRFLHYFWLSLSLSGSLRACIFYIRSVDEERNLTFPFFFLFGLSLRSFTCEIEKLCWWVDIPSACRFSRAFTACSRSVAHWARRDRGKSNSYTSPSAQAPNCNFTLPPTVNKQTTFSIDRESYSDAIFTCWQVWSAAVWEKREGSFEPRGRRFELPWQPKDDCGKQIKQQEMECLWNFSTFFCCPWFECMSIDLQRTWLGGFGQKLIRVFSLPSQCRQCQTSTLWGGLKLCAQLCRVVYTFCRCYWGFLSWKPYRPTPFRRNSRKPLALAENNVYFSVHEQFKPCQGKFSNSTWSLGLRKRDGSGSSPDHQCIPCIFLLLFLLHYFFIFFFFLPFLFCNERRSRLHADDWEFTLKYYVWTYVRVPW